MPTSPFTDVWHFLTATTNDYLHQGNWRYRRPESAAARRFGRPRSGRIHIAEEMAMRLQGKMAPISGGSSIELATARLFAAEGVARSGRLFLLEMTDRGGSHGQD